MKLRHCRPWWAVVMVVVVIVCLALGLPWWAPWVVAVLGPGAWMRLPWYDPPHGWHRRMARWHVLPGRAREMWEAAAEHAPDGEVWLVVLQGADAPPRAAVVQIGAVRYCVWATEQRRLWLIMACTTEDGPRRGRTRRHWLRSGVRERLAL